MFKEGDELIAISGGGWGDQVGNIFIVTEYYPSTNDLDENVSGYWKKNKRSDSFYCRYFKLHKTVKNEDRL